MGELINQAYGHVSIWTGLKTVGTFNASSCHTKLSEYTILTRNKTVVYTLDYAIVAGLKNFELTLDNAGKLCVAFCTISYL
jgi:hypothetical protein